MQDRDKPATPQELERDAKLARALRANLRRRKAADREPLSEGDAPVDDKRS